MNINFKNWLTLLNDLHIFEYIILCVLSLLLNIPVFKLIQLGYLGSSLKFKFNNYLYKKI